MKYKNILCALLLFFMIGSLGACNKKSEEKAVVTSVEESTEAVKEVTHTQSSVEKSTVEATTKAEPDIPQVVKLDYSDSDNWIYSGYEKQSEDKKPVDVFIIAGEADLGDKYVMDMTEDDKKLLRCDVNIQKGVYEDRARVFAPYIPQMGHASFGLMKSVRDALADSVYENVKASFEYYLENLSENRSFILAGYSYGAEFVYRLIEDYMGDEDLEGAMVVAYAIGWPLEVSRVEANHNLMPARSMRDVGVIVTYDCEAKGVESTNIFDRYTKSYVINPINWKTDETLASNYSNLGSCFFDEDGNMIREEKELCGCYVEPKRGSLKVQGLTVQDYPPKIRGFQEGAYHAYDYQLFYRNLQENVAVRVLTYMELIDTNYTE